MTRNEPDTVVLDTGILTRAIIENASPYTDILELIALGSIRLYTIKSVVWEYEAIFRKKKLHDGQVISDSHRRKLQEILFFKTSLSDKYNHPKPPFSDLPLKDDEDYKFILAASRAAVYAHGLCYLITQDEHITNVGDILRQVNVIALTANEFINQP
jgi:predicted nucleic acid-binding protein